MIIKPTELCVIRRTMLLWFIESIVHIASYRPSSCLVVYRALVGNGLAGQTIHRASTLCMHGVLACNAYKQ